MDGEVIVPPNTTMPPPSGRAVAPSSYLVGHECGAVRAIMHVGSCAMCVSEYEGSVSTCASVSAIVYLVHVRCAFQCQTHAKFSNTRHAKSVFKRHISQS